MKQREIALLKQSLDLKLTLPGSKSITNRALLLAALSVGKSKLFGVLDSDDTRVMIKALQQLGVKVTKKNDYHEIKGCGGEFKAGKITLDLNNAGTATRFLTAMMVLRGGETVITGNERMQERPIGDLVEGLRQLGAEVVYVGKEGFPPLKILNSEFRKRNSDLKIRKSKFKITMKGDKSSQYFSALLMLAPLLGAPVTIEVVGDLVSKPYIDTTIALMRSFGVKAKNNQYQSFEIAPQSYQATDYRIEGDASAATYFSSLNFLHGGNLELENLNYQNSIQGDSDYVSSLKKLLSKAPQAIDMNQMPDAAMSLAISAAFKPGKTKLTGLSTLKIKETDRLKALKTEMTKLGIKVSTTKDAITIEGKEVYKRLDPEVEIETYKDHRMAMCFSMMGTLLPGLQIMDPDCTDKTYPDFWLDLERAYLASIDIKDKHLVLIGMRGAGKSYLGKRIAKLLNRPFLDTDKEIEEEQGMPIWDMVRKKGWGYFRDLEQNFCSRIAIEEEYSKEPLVISTGGGCILNSENMKHLKQNAVTVFIFADPHILAERVMRKKSRPPLQEGQKAEEEIHKLWADRRPLYYQYADVVWDNTSGEVVEQMLPELFS